VFPKEREGMFGVDFTGFLYARLLCSWGKLCSAMIMVFVGKFLWIYER